MEYDKIKINTLYTLGNTYCIYFYKAIANKKKNGAIVLSYECFGFEREDQQVRGEWHILPMYYEESYYRVDPQWEIAKEANIELYRTFLSRFFSERDIEYLDEVEM
jgi:hypothetical protein